VQQWSVFLEEHLVQAHPGRDTQILKLHLAEGFLSRRTNALTKFILRRQLEVKDQFTHFVYRGKWRHDLVTTLHLYNPELPTVLLIDKRGYIRWHAVGWPTEKALGTLTPIVRQLATEKKDFV
jgi:hypothetical protein